MPSSGPILSRRHLLVGATGLALLGAAACGDKAPLKDVDALVGQLDRARNDSQLATDAAAARPKSAPPPVAAVTAALTTVANHRTEHARALSEEITRMSGDAPTTSSTSSSSSSATSVTSPTTSTTAAPVKPPTAADVVSALKQSADGAALLAAQQSGYRAGLLGSIAAACTAAATVGLADVGRTS